MLGRATVLKSLVCIDRVSVLSENVSIETVLSICGLSTPLFFLESRGGSFCGHFYTTQGMMCASGLQTVSEARSSVRVLLHKCYLWVCKRISVYKQSSLCVTKELGESYWPVFTWPKEIDKKRTYHIICQWHKKEEWIKIKIWSEDCRYLQIFVVVEFGHKNWSMWKVRNSATLQAWTLDLIKMNSNIAKGTTDPRDEFISQVYSSQFTNLDQITISESQLSINFKISTKHQHLD